MIGRTNVGGGAGLNFKVVGNPQPSNPVENTIWVDTDAQITSWVFSAGQPETAAEGMVWFSIGKSSTVAFNALKKNNITVYPLSAKQHISGEWVERTAKSYQGGQWVEWIPEGVLYNSGNPCIPITGGWSADGVSAPNYTIIPGELKADHMYIGSEGGHTSNAAYAVMFTVGKVPIASSNKKLCINYTQLAVTGGISMTAGVASSRAINSWVASADCSAAVGTTTTLNIDISSVAGAYYIGFCVWIGRDTKRALKVNKIWLE